MPHRSPFEIVKGVSKKDDSPILKANGRDGISPRESSELSSSRGPMRHTSKLESDSKADPPVGEATNRNDSPLGTSLRLLASDSSEQGLWRQAWDDDLLKMLPPDFDSIDTLDAKIQVQKVREIARSRAEDAQIHQRKIPHTNKTYRQVYSKVASYANKFQIVGDMVVQAEPVYSALPWALIKFAIQCSVGEDEAFNTMISGAELVGDLVCQYPALEQLYAKIESELSRKLRKSLVKFYKSILQFQIHAINYFDPHCKAKRAMLGMNPVTAATIKQYRQDVDIDKHQVDEDAALVSFEVAKLGIDSLKAGQAGQEKQLEDVKDGIKALAGNTGQAIRNLSREQREMMKARNDVLIQMWKGPLDDLKAKLIDQELERARKNVHDIRTWLSVTMPREDLMAARQKRSMALGDWLFQNPKFKHWETLEESAMLWMHGFAGTGKTGIVSRIINEVDAWDQNSGRTAYFFCSNDNASTASEEKLSRSDPIEVLRSIVSHLATSEEGNYVAPILQNKYDTNGPNSDQALNIGYSDCVDILVAVSEHMQINIIIDAFDECDQGKSPRLVQCLQEVIRRSPKNVKVFISTRSFPAIEDALTPERSIEVTAADNGGDVRTFIHATLTNRINEGMLLNGNVPEDLKEEIEVKLTGRAGSMFLYASLLINQLCDKNHNDDEFSIRKKLESLPRDLTDVYNRIMVEIHDVKNNSDRSCRIAQNTFKWLLYAQEPLRNDAFLEAISPPELKARHEEVLRSCRTLVVKGRHAYEFAHYSVREHVGQMIEYNASKCHLVATQSCLNLLNISFGTDKARRGLSEAQKLFEQYALLYWPLHYEGIDQNDVRDQRAAINGSLRSLLLQGRSQRNRYDEWFEQVRKKERQLKENNYLASKFSALEASPLSPLFAACVFGLEDLIAKFGRELDGLNKLNSHGQSALCLAIENNKLDVVKSLLSRRFPADLNLLNIKAIEQLENWEEEPHEIIRYASAMQCAAATGRLKIAEYLIEQGAHIDLVAGYYGSPLQAAALKGHTAIVELLLRMGAEPNSQGGYHGNALQAAAFAGHSTIINTLLENKPPALVGTPGGHYGSAIRAAIHSGSSDTVWALLEEKADPNMRTKGFISLLDEAASMGPSHREIVRDLLSAGGQTDVSLKGDGVHIMHRAAMFGMIELVEYCLEKKCKIDMVTTKGPKYHRRYNDFPDEMTPLGYACAEGYIDIVDLLLDHNAPFEEDKTHSALLWTAAYQGHAEVVDTLLRRFKENHTSDQTARFFLQRPHPRSGHPIVFAGVSSGKADVVEALLKHGAKYESNWYNASPLLATATFACPEVTRYFLDCHRRGSVDIRLNEQARNGRTALFEACALHRPVIANMLLEAGADYVITDGDNRTPLNICCYHAHIRLASTIIGMALRDLSRQDFQYYVNTRHRPANITALIDCSERDRISCLNLLLKYGADYTIAGNGNYTILHAATRHDNSAIMAAIVNKAAQDFKQKRFLDFLNSRHESGKTALIDAVERNRMDAINVLLSHGADYTISGHAGNTPLHWGCMCGHEDVVRTILKHAALNQSGPSDLAAIINKTNKQGLTPLMEASTRNHLAIVKTLVSYGADYTLPRIGGGLPDVTALHDACWHGSRDVAFYILERASEELDHDRLVQFVNKRNGTGKTPLLDAAETGRPLIVKMLLETYNAEYYTAKDNDVTPLHASATNGHIPIVETLLNAAATDQDKDRMKSYVNHRNDQGKTALMDAAQTGRPEILQNLLNHGADYSLLDKDSWTALHYCAFRNRINCVRILLRHASADTQAERFHNFLNQQGGRGRASALHDVARQGASHNSVAKLILEYKTLYDSLDSGKQTPLHHAVAKGNTELAKLLLEYAGRDEDRGRFKRFVNAKNNQNETAWMAAVKRDQKEVMEALKKTGVLEM